MSQAGDYVYFTIGRVTDDGELRLVQNNADQIAKSARTSLGKRLTELKEENYETPIGKVLVFTGIANLVVANKPAVVRERTALLITPTRTYMVTSQCLKDRYSEHLADFDAVLKSIRLFVPKKGGSRTLPPPGPIPTEFLNGPQIHPFDANPARAQQPAYNPPPAVPNNQPQVPVEQNPPASQPPAANPPAENPPANQPPADPNGQPPAGDPPPNQPQ